MVPSIDASTPTRAVEQRHSAWHLTPTPGGTQSNRVPPQTHGGGRGASPTLRNQGEDTLSLHPACLSAARHRGPAQGGPALCGTVTYLTHLISLFPCNMF